MKPGKCYAKGGAISGMRAPSLAPRTLERMPRPVAQPMPDISNIGISSAPLAGPSLRSQTGRRKKVGA